MANSGDHPSNPDVDLDKTELKVKQRLAKQAEVEVVEETDCSRMATKEAASCETAAGQTADNGEDQSPNSDESDRTVVDTGQLFHIGTVYSLFNDRIHMLPFVIHSFIHQGWRLAFGSLSTCLSANRRR